MRTLFKMDLIRLAVHLLVVLREVYFLQAQRGKAKCVCEQTQNRCE